MKNLKKLNLNFKDEDLHIPAGVSGKRLQRDVKRTKTSLIELDWIVGELDTRFDFMDKFFISTLGVIGRIDVQDADKKSIDGHRISMEIDFYECLLLMNASNLAKKAYADWDDDKTLFRYSLLVAANKLMDSHYSRKGLHRLFKRWRVIFK